MRTFFILIFFVINISLSNPVVAEEVGLLRTSLYKKFSDLQQYPADIFKIDEGALRPVYCYKRKSKVLIFAQYAYERPLVVLHDYKSKNSQFVILNGWGVPPLHEDSLWGKGWLLAGINPKTQKVLAVLQHEVEDPGEEIIIVTSDDTGKSWKLLSQLKKQNYLDQFEYLSLDENGHGYIVFSKFKEIGEEDHIYYSFQTSDYAKTWWPFESRPKKLAKGAFKTLSACPKTENGLIEDEVGFQKYLSRIR